MLDIMSVSFVTSAVARRAYLETQPVREMVMVVQHVPQDPVDAIILCHLVDSLDLDNLEVLLLHLHLVDLHHKNVKK